MHKWFSEVQFFHSIVSASKKITNKQQQQKRKPWTAAHQASLSITSSRSLLKTMSIDLVIPSKSLIVCCTFLLLPSNFPSIRVFSKESGGQSIGASASRSVLPVNLQDWFPLQLTGWISLQSKGLSRVFTNTTAKKHQFFSTQVSL